MDQGEGEESVCVRQGAGAGCRVTKKQYKMKILLSIRILLHLPALECHWFV